MVAILIPLLFVLIAPAEAAVVETDRQAEPQQLVRLETPEKRGRRAAELRVGETTATTASHLFVPASYDPATPAPVLLAFSKCRESRNSPQEWKSLDSFVGTPGRRTITGSNRE